LEFQAFGLVVFPKNIIPSGLLNLNAHLAEQAALAKLKKNLNQSKIKMNTAKALALQNWACIKLLQPLPKHY
jgi:hypothetical protein